MATSVSVPFSSVTARFPISPLRSTSRCVKLTSDEQRAKAREHQKKWREKLKKNAEKSSEYREQQKERTKIWKEKLRCDEQRYEEVSKKHQERCKKWWEKLTPEQRKEKRRQYNARWRQNRTKTDGEHDQVSMADPKEMVEICMDMHGHHSHTHGHPGHHSHMHHPPPPHPYKSYSDVLMESEAANKTQQPPHFYSKSKFLPYSIRNWL